MEWVLPAGAPTRYRKEFAEQAYKLCLLGATDPELADFFGVVEKTLHNWRKRHKEFLQATMDGKDLADAKVAEKLYHRAIGYEHEEDKIFNNNGQLLIAPTVKRYPPDTQAASLWLRNRQPDKWRDRKEVDVNDITDRTDEQLTTRTLELLGKAGVGGFAGGTGAPEQEE